MTPRRCQSHSRPHRRPARRLGPPYLGGAVAELSAGPGRGGLTCPWLRGRPARRAPGSGSWSAAGTGTSSARPGSGTARAAPRGSGSSAATGRGAGVPGPAARGRGRAGRAATRSRGAAGRPLPDAARCGSPWAPGPGPAPRAATPPRPERVGAPRPDPATRLPPSRGAPPGLQAPNRGNALARPEPDAWTQFSATGSVNLDTSRISLCLRSSSVKRDQTALMSWRGGETK